MDEYRRLEEHQVKQKERKRTMKNELRDMLSQESESSDIEELREDITRIEKQIAAVQRLADIAHDVIMSELSNIEETGTSISGEENS